MVIYLDLVLRSTQAKGAWSFLQPRNAAKVNAIIAKFAFAYGVQVMSMANVGNHLHLHLRLQTRFGYKPFIRSVTGAIALAITGRTRWNQNRSRIREPSAKFWDHRPFTRVVIGFRAVLHVKDYLRINQFEGWGVTKSAAREILRMEMKNRGRGGFGASG